MTTTNRSIKKYRKKYEDGFLKYSPRLGHYIDIRKYMEQAFRGKL